MIMRNGKPNREPNTNGSGSEYLLYFVIKQTFYLTSPAYNTITLICKNKQLQIVSVHASIHLLLLFQLMLCFPPSCAPPLPVQAP